jgi:hypothetical protein
MPDYRLYVFDDEGQLVGPAVVIHATSDDDAILQAETVRGALAAEVKDGFRLVRVFFAGPRIRAPRSRPSPGS